MVMNNEEAALLDKLEALARAATPGPWGVETIESDGHYGTDEDGGHGFDAYVVTDDRGRPLMDSLNRDNSEIHEEYNEESHYAWDELARRDALFIAAANPATVLQLIQLARRSTGCEADKTSGSDKQALTECAECHGHGCTHYPDGEWQGKCYVCKGTGIAQQALRPAEPVAIRWPASRGGKWRFADVNDTVPAEVLDDPKLERLYAAPAPAAEEVRDAKDAARYVAWRNAMTTEDENFYTVLMAHLPAHEGRPSNHKVDEAIDAAMSACATKVASSQTKKESK